MIVSAKYKQLREVESIEEFKQVFVRCVECVLSVLLERQTLI